MGMLALGVIVWPLALLDPWLARSVLAGIVGALIVSLIGAVVSGFNHRGLHGSGPSRHHHLATAPGGIPGEITGMADIWLIRAKQEQAEKHACRHFSRNLTARNATAPCGRAIIPFELRRRLPLLARAEPPLLTDSPHLRPVLSSACRGFHSAAPEQARPLTGPLRPRRPRWSWDVSWDRPRPNYPQSLVRRGLSDPGRLGVPAG